MRIQAYQTKALQEAMDGQASKRLAAFVRRHFPALCKTLTAEQFSAAVTARESAAKRNGYLSERDIVTYTSLSLHLGAGFSSDPQLPWAGRTLSLSTIDKQARLALTYKRAIAHLRQVHGAGDAHWLAAMSRFQRSLSTTRLSKRAGAVRTDEVASWLRNLFPQKCVTLGNEGTRALVAATTQLTSRYDLEISGATVLLAGLQLMLGHEFHQDSQHPWAFDMLRQGADSAAARLDRLQLSTVRALDTWNQAHKAQPARVAVAVLDAPPAVLAMQNRSWAPGLQA